MFSLRIVNSDFYITDPIPDLDVCNSNFRENTSTISTNKVPVIRIYGATPIGQKTCLHVHGIFPYIYVPYDGTQPTDKYVKQFAASVDFAVQVALGKASSSRRHVYEITVVKGTPYYGYHEGERDFLKIVLYNPFLVTRVVSLLQNGAIMNKVFQPHEAHIPYMLQFFMDYNLYGMNLLHASAVKFRTPVRLIDGEAGTIATSSLSSKTMTSPPPTQTCSSSLTQIWNEETVCKDWILGSTVERLSFCELEVDVLAADILNKLEIGVNVGSNPGLAAIWEDEQQRRREANESSQIAAPPSDERVLVQETETEKNFKERIKEIIEERDVLVQSQMSKLGRGALSPQELTSFQDSISSMAASQKDVTVNNDSLDAVAVLQLLSQHVDESAAAAASSQAVIDEDEPVVNQSIVQEVIEATQRSFSQELSSSLDKEMVNLLASLAEESSPPGASQKTPLSQSIILDQGDAPCDEEANDEEELSESEESIMMSQRVWDDIDVVPSAETGDDETDAQQNDSPSQRASQYDMEGMTDTWIGSFLGEDIPQLDGAADEDSGGKEDFTIRRGRRTKGKTKKSSDKGDNTSKKTHISTAREISQKLTSDPRSSKRSLEHEDAEKSGESLSEDVWPQTTRAIRTYSKKSMSLSKGRNCPPPNEEMTTKKENEEMGGVDAEKKQLENCGHKFKLVLSDSSESEGEIIREENVGSKRNEIGLYFERQTLEENAISKTETSTARNNKGATSECCTPVITKDCHSPGKNPENTKRQIDQPSSSVGQSSASFEHSEREVLPQCSKQQGVDLRKITLRKRKLIEADKKERKLSSRIASRRTSKTSDVVASLGVVSDAMADLRVSLQDVSHKSTLSSTFNEAKQRLRQRRRDFTVIRGRLNSPDRKQTLSEKRSSQLKNDEKSLLLKKRSSPKRREERMKKYGLIPVVIEKSPKKNKAVVDDFVPVTNRRVEASSANTNAAQISQGSRDSNNCDVNLSSGMGQASSRNRARVSGLFSQLITSVSPGGSTEKSRSASISSRVLSLKSPGKSRDKSRHELCHVLNMQRRGLKRKLIVDTGEKDRQSKPGKDLSVFGKKRKLSLTLSKRDRTQLDEKEKRDSETLVTSTENVSTEENLSVCEDEDAISKTQLSTENSGKCLHSDDENQFASNTDILDGITCIPSSPGDSDSNEDSVKCAESSVTITESTTLPLSKKTPSFFGQSDDTRDVSVSSKSELKVLDNSFDGLNGSQVLSQEIDFPKERDTELLANALFNMSYPSPLPSMDECYSPPCPSSPIDVKRGTSDLENGGNLLEGHDHFSINSSIVEEDEGEVLGVAEASGMFISSLSQVNQIVHCSSVDVDSQRKSSLLKIGPQLGETQSQFESTFLEDSDAKARRHFAIENSCNRVNEVDGDIEITVKSCTSHVNNSKPNANVDHPTMEENVIEREKDCKSIPEFAVTEDKSCERTTIREIESNVSVADSRIRGSAGTGLLQTCVNDVTEADENMCTGSDEQEFVLRFSAAEDNSTDFQPLEHSNLHTGQKEILMEDDIQDRPICTENLFNSRVAPELRKTPVGVGKYRSYSTNSGQTIFNSFSVEISKSESSKCKNIAIEPLKRPPSSEELVNTLKDYGLPQCRYQQPFCSDPDDLPSCPREVGGQILRIQSKQVSSLPEFESAGSLQGLKHWRFVLSTALESGLRDICQTVEDAANIDKNVELKIALMGDGDVVVTPCRGPPTPEAVKAWAREKLAKRRDEKQGTVLKNVEPKQGTSKDGNLENVCKEQLSDQTKIVSGVSNTSKLEPKQAIPKTTPKIPSNKVTSESGADDFIAVTEQKRKTIDGIHRGKKIDVIALSNSPSPVEVTSPCSLFSPNERKTFTFASGCTQTDKQHLSEMSGTQPMNVNRALTLAGHPDEQAKTVVATEINSVTVTPSVTATQSLAVTSSVHHSPEGTPQQSPLTTEEPLSPILQTQSPIFTTPFHSTPVATKLVVQSPRCTPISGATKVKSLKTNAEIPVKNDTGYQASSDQAPLLRRQLLASQFKFVTPDAQPRRLMAWSSQIDGPSPNNTYGFKVTQINLRDTKALHEVQHLTLFSLELHVRTRRDARPDPEFDTICAIFYYIQTDTPLPSGKNKITGIICVDSKSAKISSSATENKERSIPNTETTTLVSPIRDAVASTSTSDISMSRTSQSMSTSHPRALLSRSGITDHDVQYVAEEKDLFPALIRIIRKWDPDILIGYEVQMFSWGFLLERALIFEIDLCSLLSRVKGSSSGSNMDAEKDRWGAAHTSEFKIAGRIILNVWRLMRHEVTLNTYSFENVVFHVLHERIPLYTFRTLSDWWDHRTSLNRWRTVDHYVRRCRGNVRILESLDFIGRTSELARLFGILFFSVISRGSQYRVESMMLRIAKPMNYIPVSPSVEQRGLMRAPETIPLVMEPESRFYSDPVLVLDFQSLYPSMIIAYNYCFSTCLGRVSCLSEYGEFKFGATSLCVPPSLLKKLEGDIHISPNGVAYVKSNVRKGILPSMLDEILETRIMVKASMKRWKSDKALGRMLDARQLGLKLIANVTFGYTSAHFSGRMPCVEIGDSIVRKARETLERAIDLVNNTPRWGARVVYGDTDSLFVLLKGATKEQAFNIGKDIVDTVTAMNPKPVKLKFEKVYLPCVLQTKKRYVGYMYETLDQKEPVFDAKGIETVRRDSCPAVAKILEKSLRILFETRDLSLIKKYVQRQCTKLMEGRASLQDFTFAKEYRGMKNYKPGACVPALELTRRLLREDRRSEPRVGERVPYVVVYGSPGLPLIQLVRRPHEVLQDPSLRLNASYYITKQIMPPLNRVFSLIGLDVFTWYAELPRVVRVAQMPTDPGDRKKGTISQYFSTMTCPVCQELTPTDICAKCRAKPQRSAVTLLTRMRGWERTHQHLAEICYGCCGSRDTKLCCVSLDCPVFYKLVQCTRDLKSSQHLRKILDSL